MVRRRRPRGVDGDAQGSFRRSHRSRRLVRSTPFLLFRPPAEGGRRVRQDGAAVRPERRCSLVAAEPVVRFSRRSGSGPSPALADSSPCSGGTSRPPCLHPADLPLRPPRRRHASGRRADPPDRPSQPAPSASATSAPTTCRTGFQETPTQPWSARPFRATPSLCVGSMKFHRNRPRRPTSALPDEAVGAEPGPTGRPTSPYRPFSTAAAAAAVPRAGFLATSPAASRTSWERCPRGCSGPAARLEKSFRFRPPTGVATPLRLLY